MVYSMLLLRLHAVSSKLQACYGKVLQVPLRVQALTPMGLRSPRLVLLHVQQLIAALNDP